MPEFIVEWMEHHEITVEAETIYEAGELAKELIGYSEESYCCMKDLNIISGDKSNE